MSKQGVDHDVKVGLALMALSAAAWIASYYFPETAIWAGGSSDRPYQANAGTWPRIVCVALFVLSFILIVMKKFFPDAAIPKEEKELAEKEEEAERPVQTRQSRRNAIGFLAGFLLYLFLIVPLGFPISTLLFGIGCVLSLDMGRMSKKAGLIWSVGVSAIIIVLFCRVLYLPLPRGMGIFRELTHMIIF